MDASLLGVISRAPSTRRAGQPSRAEPRSPASTPSRRRPSAASPCGAALWSATWPKVLAIGIVARSRGSSSCSAAGSRPTSCPRPIDVLGRLWSDLGTAELWNAIIDHAPARRSGLRASRSSSASAMGVAGVAVRGPSRRRRLADHGPPDHALDRVVPARDPAVQAHRGGDHLRRRPRRRAVDRQRADPRRRPHPAGPARARGGSLGAKGHRRLPLRRPARRDAQLRGRPQAGLGVRLAEPDGRRAARRHREQGLARPAAPGQPRPRRTARACSRPCS